MQVIIFRISLSFLLVGILVAIIPLAYPVTEIDFVIGEVGATTNVVLPISFHYLKVSLEGGTFSSTVQVLRASSDGSLTSLYNSTYGGPVTISVEPGTYIIQILPTTLSQPVKLIINSFGFPARQLEIGATLAIIGVVYPASTIVFSQSKKSET